MSPSCAHNTLPGPCPSRPVSRPLHQPPSPLGTAQPACFLLPSPGPSPAWVRDGTWGWGGRGQRAPVNQGQRPRWDLNLSQSVQGRARLGPTSADLGVAGAALAGRPRAGRPPTVAGAQLLPSPTRNTAVLPGTPGAPDPRAGAVRHLLALQDASHTGAGDKEGGFRRQGPARCPKGPTAQQAAHPFPGSVAHQLSHGPVTTSPGSRLSQELSPDPADRLWFSGIPEGTGVGAGPSDSSAHHTNASSRSATSLLALYRIPPHGDPDPGPAEGCRRMRGRRRPGMLERPGAAHPCPAAQVGPCGQSGRDETSRCCSGGGWGRGWETLTHGSGLVLAAALGWGHTMTILEQLAGGAPTAGLAARQAWLTHDPRGQVLAGAGAGLPTGKKSLATGTVYNRKEAERAGAAWGSSLRTPAVG